MTEKPSTEIPAASQWQPRQVLDPFDAMRTNRVLAPQDPKVNDLRWLIGEALRRTHLRANSHQGLGVDKARLKLRRAERKVGPHAWPLVRRIIIEGAGVRECRAFILDVSTPWRADAIILDRLRCALDVIGPLLGVTS